MATGENEIVISQRINLRRDGQWKVLRFEDSAILVGIDTLHLGVNVHLTLEELRQIHIAIGEVLAYVAPQ